MTFQPSVIDLKVFLDKPIQQYDECSSVHLEVAAMVDEALVSSGLLSLECNVIPQGLVERLMTTSAQFFAQDRVRLFEYISTFS